ncbi:TetR/AcrR family transcriptional regulator [Geodermatophilus sabuli]|uniref:TetR/AcrR family transcriptional regulator n=1 Tax=Geodermatophilus sabuli TaxID=1564158 RepID=A0A7K3VWL6_9ACTN|nr:TetR/AcrR family transcriptional regulator [Geodermatophilus sabuli]NEK56760.1 TetR/AcrR family transcriptional regulator [Geodermatophilus sabuli]
MPTTPAAVQALAVRPPQQRRSRERWAQILDAGVALLEEGGYEAFTIAAVCERASVPPRAIYARTASKDALFLAVYEHGMARVRTDQDVLADVEGWSHLVGRDRIRRAVSAVASVFATHAAFLRAVVLVSGAHPEVAERGRVYADELTDAFAAVVLPLGSELRSDDAETAVRASFSTVFAALVMRTAYGPTFAWGGLEEHAFVRHLGDIVADHLLGAPSGT